MYILTTIVVSSCDYDPVLTSGIKETLLSPIVFVIFMGILVVITLKPIKPSKKTKHWNVPVGFLRVFLFETQWKTETKWGFPWVEIIVAIQISLRCNEELLWSQLYILQLKIKNICEGGCIFLFQKIHLFQKYIIQLHEHTHMHSSMLVANYIIKSSQ